LPDHQEIAQEIAPPPDVSDEIGASLASVWARYVGARPTEATIEVETGVVRWLLVDGAGEFERGLKSTNEGRDEASPEFTLTGFRRETSAVVSRATHNRVVARMSKSNKDTGVATETFILDAIRKKQ
jgi:hypothetical protein